MIDYAPCPHCGTMLTAKHAAAVADPEQPEFCPNVFVSEVSPPVSSATNPTTGNAS